VPLHVDIPADRLHESAAIPVTETTPDDAKARALIARCLLTTGRACATVVSDRTGDEITVQAKAKTNQGGRWRLCPITEATAVYLDVPHAEGGGGTPIGTLYVNGPRAGLMFYATNVDQERVRAARHVLLTAAGTTDLTDRILAGTHCFECGRELRRKDSILLGYGPECAEKIGLGGGYTNRHQRPGEDFFPDATVNRSLYGPAVDDPSLGVPDGFDPDTHAERHRAERLAIQDPGPEPGLFADDTLHHVPLVPADVRAEVDAVAFLQRLQGDEPATPTPAAPAGLIVLTPDQDPRQVLADLEAKGI
jgi:hypothetical protein